MLFFVSRVFQQTFGKIQQTFGKIQQTFGKIQQTFGKIQPNLWDSQKASPEKTAFSRKYAPNCGFFHLKVVIYIYIISMKFPECILVHVFLFF